MKGLFSRHGKRFAKFGIVGAIGFLVDTLVLNLQLPFYSSNFLRRALAPFFSFEAAVFSNYALYHHWVWKDRKKESHSAYWRGFLHYNLTAALGFLIKLTFMNIAILLFHALDIWRLFQLFLPFLNDINTEYFYTASLFLPDVTALIDTLYINIGNLGGVFVAAIFNYAVVEKIIFRKKKSAS